jgi:hypothetical protein
MTSTLEDEIRKVREQASILADETRRKVTGALEDEIRKAQEQANIFAEEARVLHEEADTRIRAALQRCRKARERLGELLEAEKKLSSR